MYHAQHDTPIVLWVEKSLRHGGKIYTWQHRVAGPMYTLLTRPFGTYGRKCYDPYQNHDCRPIVDRDAITFQDLGSTGLISDLRNMTSKKKVKRSDIVVNPSGAFLSLRARDQRQP